MLSQTHCYDWFVQFRNTAKSIAAPFNDLKTVTGSQPKKKILNVTNVSEPSVNQEDSKIALHLSFEV